MIAAISHWITALCERYTCGYINNYQLGISIGRAVVAALSGPGATSGRQERRACVPDSQHSVDAATAPLAVHHVARTVTALRKCPIQKRKVNVCLSKLLATFLQVRSTKINETINFYSSYFMFHYFSNFWSYFFMCQDRDIQHQIDFGLLYVSSGLYSQATAITVFLQ